MANKFKYRNYTVQGELKHGKNNWYNYDKYNISPINSNDINSNGNVSIKKQISNKWKNRRGKTVTLIESENPWFKNKELFNDSVDNTDKIIIDENLNKQKDNTPEPDSDCDKTEKIIETFEKNNNTKNNTKNNNVTNAALVLLLIIMTLVLLRNVM